MKNRIMKMGATLCAGLVLLTGSMALAEEKRLGDYIYVPAMTVSESVGTISLRVSGMALERESDIPVMVDSLAGAEFGVYVFSDAGELTPWANPLFPSEQMRIRTTGEGSVSFSLPQGVEFYLRQESAPQGYLFDPNALIRVEGTEIVVTNKMAGELLVSVQDSLGVPVSNVGIEAVDENGTVYSVVTDERGEAVIRCEEEAALTVRETVLPYGAFDAIRVHVNGEETQNALAGVEPAARTRLNFEHPAAGSIELSIRLVDVDEQGEMVSEPLSGVKMQILGAEEREIVTDESGSASISLLEGLYDVRFSYEGVEELFLSHTEGQSIVKSGAHTRIDLTAARLSGRIVAQAICERETIGGSVVYEEINGGKAYGPYSFDMEGCAVSDSLPAGMYRVAEIAAPDSTQIGSMQYDGAAYENTDFVLTVNPGLASEVSIELLTEEKQTYSLYKQEINDRGEIVQQPLDGPLELTLLDEAGRVVGKVEAENGVAEIEALSGTYTLLMDEALASEKNISAVSQPFVLPGDEETLSFAADGTRLILMSIDENGEPVYGAAYSVMDSTGMESILAMDQDAQGITPLLSAGEIRIESVHAPLNHDESAMMTVMAKAGEATLVEVVHPSYGHAQISANVRRISDRGTSLLSAFAGVAMRIYRVESDGQTLVDTGLSVISGEEGVASVQLKPGVYAAQFDADSLPEGYKLGEAAVFSVENMADTNVQLECMDPLGGVSVNLAGGALSADQLAQVRFELTGEDEQAHSLMLNDGVFFAGRLEPGRYTLRQTQIPQGYTLAKELELEVSEGTLTQISVPLEEYAVLCVSKMGVTFNDRMQTYLVPLSGQYAVYTEEAGEMKPYPSEKDQLTLWANVTPEQIAEGKVAALRLPADMDGTTYYIREIGGAAGFADDQTYHEAKLIAGETAEISCAVSSDRGFFSFAQYDAQTGEHVSGGQYELIDNLTGETVHRFTLGEESYRNAMAVPIGDYTLVQISAGDGYAMSEPASCAVFIEPYLTQGGTVTHAAMNSARIPQNEEIDVIYDLYTAVQEGLTLVMIEGAPIATGETLRVPQMTIRLGSESGSRSDIGSVILSGASDAEGGRYAARVEYCLEGGGWQPSDARMTQELSAPVCISLTDIEDDIAAIRVTYINADTGEEKAGIGFNPGQISLSAEVSAVGEVLMTAEVCFDGEFVYRTQFDGEKHALERSARREIRFAAEGAGEFNTVSAGRDGRITGTVFFDENADGIMDAGDHARYAGMTVNLLTPSMETVSTCRTDGSGRYEFKGLSGGEYILQFEAGEKLVFSSGEGYSEHAVSGVDDKQYGISRLLRFDGDHTDYVVNAGCIYAAHASGSLTEKTAEGTLRGFEGLNIELMASDGGDEEPIVVMTDASGAFRFARILPGAYDVTIALPQGYLCKEAEDGVIERQIMIAQGEEFDIGEFIIARKSSVSGGVYVDEDGDGVFAQEARILTGAQVSLIRHEDGHSEVVARTTTNEYGTYLFDDLQDGEYSILFDIDDGWTFTRFGQDSMVYGAVSSSGSTKSFKIMPDMHMEHVNAGITLPAQLEVFVFADEHADGNKGVYDVGLAGVTLTLIRQENGQDAEQVSLTTGNDGIALFDGLAPGEYVLAYQMPGIYRATKQLQSSTYPTSCVPQTTLSTGRSEPFMLNMGSENARKYIGAMLSGRISGTVYYDNDADARIGEDEPACADVLVELLSGDQVIDTRYSDANGEYVFEGLAPGRYVVRFNAQDECGFSGSERSMTRGGVQKSEESVSTTRSLTVTAGGKLTTVHAGVVRLASIQGTLFVDGNADRVMNDQEERFAGVSVHLMNGTARNILMSTVTAQDGSFSFDRVTPGTYLLRIDLPDGYVFSGAIDASPLALNDVRDGRGYSAAFELLGGAHAQGIGFGLLTQGMISGRVWIDEDYDGRISDSEDGMRGAVITLNDLSGNVVASKSTLRSGEFAFDGLMPGEYTLNVALNEGYVFTAGNGDSQMDQIDQSSASLYLGRLEMGAAVRDVTIGAIRPASVSGMVWLDENNDGRRLDGDSGVSGVAVSLMMVSGADSGKVMTVQTDASGAYRFDGVKPGEAQLRFEIEQGYAFAKKAAGSRRVSCVPMSDALSAQSDVFTIVSSANIADKDAGVLPVGSISGSVWEDASYNGKADPDENAVAGARIALIHAESGEEITAVMTDDEGLYEIGFVRPGEYALSFELPDGMIFTCEGESVISMADVSRATTERFEMALGQSRSGVLAGAIVPAGISGKIAVDWNENGICEEDEPGLEQAVVTVMQGGTIVTSAKTQEDGAFSIDALRPGSYRVRIAMPEAALFSKGAGISLATADAQEGETGEYLLAMGQKETVPAITAVLTGSITGRAWLDSDTNGAMDPQELPMTGVTAELLDENGNVIRSMGVLDDGTYRFDLLRSGTYAVRYTLGSGVLFADRTGDAAGSCVDPVDGTTAVTQAFTLGQEQTIDNMNVGGILPGSIGDTVFLDHNGNGLMDYREPQLPDVSLELLRVENDGTLVLAAQTVSDEYGYYVFGDLRPGSYVLNVPLADGETLTQHIGAPLGEIDSDVNPETGRTDVISLVSGQVLRNIDIGFSVH